MTRNLHAAIAVVLAFVACLLAGCGSSSSSEPLSKAEFAKQGTEICTKAAQQRNEDLKAATGESDESGEGGEISEYVDVAMESVEDMAGELSELEPPAAQKKATEGLVEDLEREVEAVKASPDKPISASFKSANAMARQAGLPACTI